MSSTRNADKYKKVDKSTTLVQNVQKCIKLIHLSEFWNFIWIQTIFPKKKNGIQKKFKHFAKNPNSQRICHFYLKLHFQTKWQIHTKRTDFLAEFSATILLLNSADFLLVSNCLNSAKASKAISATLVSSLWIRLQKAYL